jgi:LacI family transcriptional regulator
MSVTMKDIAAMANVSQAAVSIAINNKKSTRVSEQKRQEIIDLAKKLGYSPSVSARHLRGKETNTIGIIGGVSGVPVQRSLIWRITRLLRKNGYNSMLADTQTNLQSSIEIINEFVAHGVDGIIIASHNDLNIEPPVPCLRIDTDNEDADIGIDKEYGGYEITRHLINEHNHRKIAFFTFVLQGAQNRYKGHLRALKEAGIKRDDDLLLITRNNAKMENKILDLINSGKVTAFCCSNDYLAAQLIAFLQRNGIKVPADVAITGFDGLRLTEFLNPSITTAIQPMFELADLGVDILMQKLGKSPITQGKRFLKPELHIGESCGCKNKSIYTSFADFRTFETIEACLKYSEEERSQ